MNATEPSFEVRLPDTATMLEINPAPLVSEVDLCGVGAQLEAIADTRAWNLRQKAPMNRRVMPCA